MHLIVLIILWPFCFWTLLYIGLRPYIYIDTMSLYSTNEEYFKYLDTTTFSSISSEDDFACTNSCISPYEDKKSNTFINEEITARLDASEEVWSAAGQYTGIYKYHNQAADTLYKDTKYDLYIKSELYSDKYINLLAQHARKYPYYRSVGRYTWLCWFDALPLYDQTSILHRIHTVYQFSLKNNISFIKINPNLYKLKFTDFGGEWLPNWRLISYTDKLFLTDIIIGVVMVLGLLVASSAGNPAYIMINTPT